MTGDHECISRRARISPADRAIRKVAPHADAIGRQP
jgi:hypothetical protein